MADQILTPRVIEDAPFPGDLPQSDTVKQTSGGNSIPTTAKDKSFPTKKIAHETISSALNTQSRRILAEFEFTELGAIQIGKYTPGVSGDLKVSPNGILARDLSGQLTFSIDGTTGNAVFKGLLQAGSIITGAVVVGDNSVIIDGENKRILINDGVTNRGLFGDDGK